MNALLQYAVAITARSRGNTPERFAAKARQLTWHDHDDHEPTRRAGKPEHDDYVMGSVALRPDDTHQTGLAQRFIARDELSLEASGGADDEAVEGVSDGGDTHELIELVQIEREKAQPRNGSRKTHACVSTTYLRGTTATTSQPAPQEPSHLGQILIGRKGRAAVTPEQLAAELCFDAVVVRGFSPSPLHPSACHHCDAGCMHSSIAQFGSTRSA
jgi:hypothetical protein